MVDQTDQHSFKKIETLKSEFSLIDNGPGLIRSIQEDASLENKAEPSMFTSRDLGQQKKSAPEQEVIQAIQMRSHAPVNRKI